MPDLPDDVTAFDLGRVAPFYSRNPFPPGSRAAVWFARGMKEQLNRPPQKPVRPWNDKWAMLKRLRCRPRLAWLWFIVPAALCAFVLVQNTPPGPAACFFVPGVMDEPGNPDFYGGDTRAASLSPAPVNVLHWSEAS